MHRFSLYIAIALLSAGCASFDDWHYECVNSCRSRMAWSSADYDHHAIPNFHDFGAGWRQGFYEVSLGRCGRSPVVPPKEYWSASYQSPEGAAAISAWYQGYQEGALAADKAGYGTYAPLHGTGVGSAPPADLEPGESLAPPGTSPGTSPSTWPTPGTETIPPPPLDGERALSPRALSQRNALARRTQPAPFAGGSLAASTAGPAANAGLRGSDTIRQVSGVSQYGANPGQQAANGTSRFVSGPYRQPAAGTVSPTAIAQTGSVAAQSESLDSAGERIARLPPVADAASGALVR